MNGVLVNKFFFVSQRFDSLIRCIVDWFVFLTKNNALNKDYIFLLHSKLVIVLFWAIVYLYKSLEFEEMDSGIV